MSMKNSNDTFGNRTRDLPVCSAVPQQTVKRKAIPLQAWTGHEGSSRLRFPDFKIINTWKW